MDSLTLSIADILEAEEEALDALALERACTASLYGRLALRLARMGPHEPSTEALAEPAREADLTIGPEARWFREREQDKPVSLARRKAIRLVLAHLAGRHARGEEDPVDVYELFDVGWPDQEIDPELAAERVYWAIRTLRNLGLREHLLTRDGGYLLDPSAQIERNEDAP